VDSFHTQQIIDRGRVKLRRNPIRIRVLRGPDKKLNHQFDEDAIVIGTHESCDFKLSDPSVSRQHLEIAYVRRGLRLRDLDSTNGSLIGDLRLGEATLTRSTKVQLGNSVLHIEVLDKSVDLDLGEESAFGALRGRSSAMRRVFRLLARVAPTDSTVLITGETGTGKEIAARAIHQASRRSQRPLYVIDCGALPPTLIESELFGHERGAFTGANSAKPGAFESADGGTIFLDELGELPLELQSRLLGALERRETRRVGGTRSRSFDVRVIAATNRDLRREVNSGRFREDLFFRLAVVQASLPPLRERPEDVDLYIDHFLAELNHDEKTAFRLPEEARDELAKHPWPGNVRELRNVIERAVVLGELSLAGEASSSRSTQDSVVLPVLDKDVDVNVPYKIGKATLIESYERSYVEALMLDCEQNISRAARKAEIDRVYLLRLLDRYGLRPVRK
jgi:transcriptional regulator with GAF, ATPase, and Fis domain